MCKVLSAKTALVLSAGGMFGAYQAGCWKSLAKSGWHPDIVIGASAGALNGWAIAGGVPPDELAAAWLDPASANLARLRFPRPPWRGVFDPEPLERRIRELWRTWPPRIAIGVVAAELPRLRPALFRDAEITWRHLAASCAVLFCYPQVSIGGRLYTDGGILNALPLWAAPRMGADRIVAVNVLARLNPSLLSAGIRTFRRLAPRAPDSPARAPATLIAPEQPLGSLRDAVFWEPRAAARWLAQGEEDASRAIAAGEITL